jgi:hypothetical protein
VSIASHTDVTGDNDYYVLLELGEEHGPRSDLAAGEIGRRTSVTTIGLDQLRRINHNARRTIRAQHRADDLRRSSLAVREYRIPTLRTVSLLRRHCAEVVL